MALRVELPKELLIEALNIAAGLRLRQAKAATNTVIKQALDQERLAYDNSIPTITETK